MCVCVCERERDRQRERERERERESELIKQLLSEILGYNYSFALRMSLQIESGIFI